ncbi:hypothetical protein ACFZCP_35215 [Streptomyces sp. NPDC007971]|uniref:hypothetical protein n=1 Tax=Streptomyces sp. NPDC007971 TaxID=3364799 RepID=UPI0036E06D7B
MAVQITEVQVRQAEARAERAEEARAVAARKLEASPYSDVAAMEHADAARTAAQERANAREIRQAYERQLEEERRRASRPALEKAAAAEIRQAGRDMDGRRKALVDAAVAAQAALVVLVDAGVTYNEALAGHVQVLAGAGLDFRDGESGGERSTLNIDRLKVHGREFHPVDPGSVGAWVLRRVAEARLSSYHHLVPGLEWLWRGVEMTQPGLKGEVAVPPVKVFPEPPRLRVARVD